MYPGGIPGVSSRFSHQIDSDQLMGVRSLLTLPHILTPELFTSLPTPLLGVYGNRPSPTIDTSTLMLQQFHVQLYCAMPDFAESRLLM
jgi:hypothetical protein